MMNSDGVYYSTHEPHDYPRPPRFKKALAAPVATSGTGETILFSAKIPGGIAAILDALRLFLAGVSSSTGTLAFKVRVGPAGTLSDPVAWTLTTSAAQVANAHAGFDGCLNIRSNGVIIDGSGFAGAVVLPTVIGAPVVVTPTITAAWFVTITCACSVGTFTAQVAEVRGL
jgi:hypothetical protein